MTTDTKGDNYYHDLTLVLRNPDMSCLCKQCRSRSDGFNLQCLPLSMWIYINNLDQVIWLAEKVEKGMASEFIQQDKG